VRGDAGEGGAVQRRADPRGRAAGRRRPRGPRRGRGPRLHRRHPGGHRRPLRRDQGAVHRLLHHRRRVQGGGDRVGQAGAQPAGQQDRDPAHPHHRRVPAGQRVGRQGARLARGDRPAVTGGGVRRTVEAVWRSESARIVGGLARYTGDVELAEDLAQEALAEALVSWSVDGVPREPTAWLLTVGRRRAVDGFRRRARLDARYAELAAHLCESVEDDLFDPERIDDDVLALMFVACHPILGKEARIAMTLRVVGGLTSQEIAQAFFVPVSTVQARITRAKKALTAAGVAFEVPDTRQRRERLGSVLQVIYLIFTEGSSASA